MKYDKALCQVAERPRAEVSARVTAKASDVRASSLDGEAALARVA